jgi:hypothetical protein
MHSCVPATTSNVKELQTRAFYKNDPLKLLIGCHRCQMYCCIVSLLLPLAWSLFHHRMGQLPDSVLLLLLLC